MPWLSSTHITTPMLGGSSRSASRPPSRPASPSLPATHLTPAHGVASPLSLDPLNDYFTLHPNVGGSSIRGNRSRASSTLGEAPPSISGSSMGGTASVLCASGAGSSSTGNAVASSSGSPPAPAPAATAASPLEIFLDNDKLVLRGQGGDMAPAYLSGYVSLYLAESTNIKDITMQLTGKARVHFQDGSSHSHTHNIVQHDWTFLESTGRRHNHTLKAGLHTFPFSFMLEGSLPSSVATPMGDGKVEYKLRASAVRAGLGGLSSLGALGFNNLHATRTFSLQRMFTPEALEFNQTLEIENTWPGKIMYSITLPFKAYAAGDSIPVILKFMPIAKGVRVLSVTSCVREYTMVYTRGSSHHEERGSITVKHEIHGGHSVLVDQEVTRPPAHWNGPREADWHAVARSGPVPSPPRGSNENVRASGSEEASETGEEITGDDEVCTSLTIPLPPWTSPSHAIKPVQITHKIKWSCAIANPDGHVSELRCALPITILDYSLLNEARTSGAAARNLMMGTTLEEAVPIDLPSYSNHVYDRVAVAEGAASSSGFSSRSLQHTPHHSPDHTPSHSRPSSPRLGRSSNDDVPPRRQLTEHESAMLRSLGMGGGGSSGNNTPPSDSHSHNSMRGSGAQSRGDSSSGSRVGSRTASRGNSRAGSRAGSPDRHHTHAHHPHHHQTLPVEDEHPERERRGISHLLKPLAVISAKAPILRNNSTPTMASTQSSPVLSGTASPRPGSGNVSFTHLPGAALGERDRSSSVTFAPSGLRELRRRERSGTGTANSVRSLTDEYLSDDNALSRVPSYTDDTEAFVVPLDPALPTYVDSQEMERARSTDGHVSVEVM